MATRTRTATAKSRAAKAAAALAAAEAKLAEEAAAAPAAEETKTEEVETPKVKPPKWEALEGERLDWIRRNARPAVAPCLCGCGNTTKGRFFPGHDATLKAALAEHDDQETLALFGWGS